MFRPLASLLPDAVRRLGVRPQVNAAQVIAALNELLLLAPLSGTAPPRAIQYRDGLIAVVVSHPAEASLLRHREASLLDELRRRFPTLAFYGLRFRTRR